MDQKRKIVNPCIGYRTQSFDRFIQSFISLFEAPEIDISTALQDSPSDNFGDPHELDSLVGNFFAHLGKSQMRSHQMHLFMHGDGDVGKLGGVFDQGEQLNAPSAHSGPSDPNGSPD